MTNYLPILRVVGFLEGVSYLLLFGVGMPLKYAYEMPSPNYYIGMTHGLLFCAYCVLLALVHYQIKWGWGKTAWGFLASLLPFGTFVADKKIFAPAAKPY